MRAILKTMVVLAIAGSSSAPSRAMVEGRMGDGAAQGRATAGADTFTWWCVDVSALLHVNVPVILGRRALVAPDPPPIPDVCAVPFPATVQAGSPFASGGGWVTNDTYPPALRAALEAAGYPFRSQSPAEDFMSKLVQIRIEVRAFADDGSGVPVAEYRFDPRAAFRLTRVKAFTGPLPLAPIVDPAAGVDLSPDEHGRLPMVSLPVVVGPVPPGHYRLWTYWTMSDLHDDGLGLADHFLSPGENLVAFPPFVVLPP